MDCIKFIFLGVPALWFGQETRVHDVVCLNPSALCLMNRLFLVDNCIEVTKKTENKTKEARYGRTITKLIPALEVAINVLKLAQRTK